MAKQTQVDMRAPLSLEPPLDEGTPSSEEVYRRYVQRVARWAARLAGPSLDAEDLVQDVFVQVHRALPGFRGDSQLSTWLFGITERVVRAKRRRERLRRLFGFASIADLDIAAAGPTPAELVERRESTALVYAALDRLRERYRSVLILFELEGLSGDEIAELKGLRVAAVWKQLSRARALLAREIERLERRRSSSR